MIEKGSFRCPNCDSLGDTHNSLETISLWEKKAINGFLDKMLMIIDIILPKIMDGQEVIFFKIIIMKQIQMNGVMKEAEEQAQIKMLKNVGIKLEEVLQKNGKIISNLNGNGQNVILNQIICWILLKNITNKKI